MWKRPSKRRKSGIEHSGSSSSDGTSEGGDSEKGSAGTPAEAESSEGKSDRLSDCSDDYDVFELGQEQNAMWLTFEDQDELIAQVIREHLRPQPLVPLDRKCPDKVYTSMDSGIAF